MSVITSSLIKQDDSEQNLEPCFHCGEPVTEPGKYTSFINSKQEPMCCAGCMAVADMIIELGLEQYYDQRTENPQRPDFLIPKQLQDAESVRLAKAEEEVCTELEDSLVEAELLIRGISCPACSWLCEKRLSSLKGVQYVTVNYTTHRAVVRWDKQLVDLNTVFDAIRDIGYEPKIYNRHNQQAHLEQERKQLLRQLGLAGVLGMQVMMISIAMYFGKHNGMQAIFLSTFEWISLLLASMVLFVAGKPFYKNALRDFKAKTVSMDHAVVLGLSLAYLASIYSVLSGRGEVYFDTVAMFVFFLSAARYFEFILRNKSLQQTNLNEYELPSVARKLINKDQQQNEEMVAAMELIVGDRILVKAGETIPADCLILSGNTQVDESLLTGESRPIEKHASDSIIAGSINMTSVIECEVTSIGKQTVLGQIQNLMNQAHDEKPRLTEFSNRIASYFISTVIMIAISTIMYHGIENISIWLDKVIAILIVSCPCALSLAMPTVYAAVIGRLAKSGVIFKHIQRLFLLNKIKNFIFDKTGICTTGRLKIKEINRFNDIDQEQCLNIVSGIEAYSEHPIARAFENTNKQRLSVKSVQTYPGKGITGEIEDKPYSIGSYDFINSIIQDRSLSLIEEPNHLTVIYLADDEKLLAQIILEDEVRRDLKTLIDKLKINHIKTYLCSGDNQTACESVASLAGIDEIQANMLPDQKLRFITQLQDNNNPVAMIGDGINDAPTLAKADVSFSISEGADLAQLQADAILLNGKLLNIYNCFSLVKFSKNIIIQNITWAISYNILALPIAIIGYLQPWMAAIGMSLSSLIVVLNADRIRRFKFK